MAFTIRHYTGKIYKTALLAVLMMCVIITAAHEAAAQRKAPTIIRDTEIENILREWAAPLYQVANIGPNTVNIIIVQDNALNAFVAGGANIFLYTGLIESTDTPGELLGVMAHELGHVTGGHLIAGRDAMERASYESMLGTIIGVGAAILSGQGGAAGAIGGGASSMAAARYLSHSRVVESSADQAALTYLEDAKMTPDGLVSFMEKLESEELLPASRQSEYVRTHPLTSNRINALRRRAESSPYKDKAFAPSWMEQHARMKAKLIAFISPGRVAWEYDDRDKSIAAEYARTIAHYRENRVQEAIESINELIAAEPDNPYFHELKGQMLVEFGRVNEGLPAYERAVEIAPDAALIRIALAHGLIESRGNEAIKLEEAIEHLNRALKGEPRSTRAYRLLATAHGRLGREDIAKLYLAEEALLQRRFSYAKMQANAALQSFPENSREWLKAKDILAYIETLPEKARLEN